MSSCPRRTASFNCLGLILFRRESVIEKNRDGLGMAVLAAPDRVRWLRSCPGSSVGPMRDQEFYNVGMTFGGSFMKGVAPVSESAALTFAPLSMRRAATAVSFPGGFEQRSGPGASGASTGRRAPVIIPQFLVAAVSCKVKGGTSLF